ncbi:energy transducer TonB [Flavobacteriaceae bacterium S0825]|uniref:energy transducer TonB n=1 Tax=Gaetbulibacter sp. S0825 TaxID=2720084 RepID=UPI00142F4B95|nr:energy transducer TonB [Gaetbulibacter sp. S0825]MCK0108499.1 energy transducer TonB [Flavobacteriaceae bacterium S0825]NIX64135.1 energy transducer TonB [Gaetbulibacter sp. S0825]
METKKNPRADVRRNSSIYFAVGLALMLLVANYSINYKTYDKEAIDIAMLSMGELDNEVIPITEHPVTPPPQTKPPVIPDDFDVKEDDDPIIEDIIDSTEDSEDDPILDVVDVDVEDVPEDDVEVPYILIEDVPVFPGCEEGNNKERRACMSNKISKHVQKKFNADLAEELGLSGKQTIRVMFKIDKTGNIVGVQSRAPHPKLEKEAARVINLLPKMKPGRQRGNAVTVSYSLPIIFQVQN